jgi:GNAT superfamily N-acetyltransferase
MADRAFIRPATNDDGVAVRELVASVLAEFGLPNNRPGTDDDLLDIEAWYDAHGTHLWVLVENGTIIGTTAILRVNASTCELRKMYLRPSARGRGFGSMLVDLCIQEARERGFGRIQLETAEALTDAMRLYERRGFRSTGTPGDELGCGVEYVLDL